MMMLFSRLSAIALFALVLPACAQESDGPDASQKAAEAQNTSEETATATAIFAGGCFWCMEGPFDKLDGVISTTSGYTDGQTKNPTYKQVSGGGTGHTEAMKVIYNPKLVGYEKLLNVFWHNIDPTDDGGQFCDRGSQYRSGIYYSGNKQKQLAEASKKELLDKDDAPSPIVTEVVKATAFYDAEDYHQNYYQVNPIRYKFYRSACGRDGRLEELWGEQAGH